MVFYIDKKYVTTDRFDLGKLAHWDIDIYDTLQSYMLYAIPKLPYTGEFSISNTVGRPDLASYNIYGSTSLWWVLMAYNAMTRPSDFKEGVLVRYPSLLALESLRLSLPAMQGAR